ncbi:MAG: hypothetical protein GX446_13105 [Chthonomonadales bacterium]|nr:hypothetical protein [Chthonomonadales bacterium]
MRLRHYLPLMVLFGSSMTGLEAQVVAEEAERAALVGATLISAKDLAGILACGGWGVGFGTAGGAVSGWSSALVYNYAHQLQVQAAMDASER